MGIRVQKRKLQVVKPGDVWYCHFCGVANEKKRGKQRQRCQNPECGKIVWLKRKRK